MEKDGGDNSQFKRQPGGSLNNRVKELPGLTSLFKGSTTSSLSHEKLQDGCVILGRDGPSGNTYTTHYVINRKAQREELCSDVLREAFYPCTMEENKGSCKKASWSIISSEAFMLSLHITVLILGVAKEALDLRTVDEDLHLIHSLLETIVTLLTIAIRIAVVRYIFKNLSDTVTPMEHVEDPSSDIRGEALRKWLYRFYFLGIFLIIVCVTCFLCFYFLVHLGWTLLSNNFCLVCITVFSGIMVEGLELITSRIREDQHKAVIHETVLLLQEAYDTQLQSKEKREAFYEKARRFTKALMDTELLQRPRHIEPARQASSTWNTMTTMQMQSFV